MEIQRLLENNPTLVNSGWAIFGEDERNACVVRCRRAFLARRVAEILDCLSDDAAVERRQSRVRNQQANNSADSQSSQLTKRIPRSKLNRILDSD